MHHPAIVLLLLLMIVLFAPLIGQGLSSAGAAIGPILAAAPGVAMLTRLAAPALVGVMLLLGVLVVGVIKILVGV